MKKLLRLSIIIMTAVIIMALGCYAETAQVVPGKNILTGTTEPMTFDGMEALPSTISNAALSSSPFADEEGKVLLATQVNQYATIGFEFEPDLPKERHYQVSFRIYQKADEGYGKDKSLWIMKNGTAGWQIAYSISGFVPNNAAGWQEHSVKLETFDKLIDKSTSAVDTADVNKILIEWGYDSKDTATVNQKIYVDDVSIVPLYMITYLDENGEVYRTAYENITGSTFVPVVSNSDAEDHIIGWSLENDGTADEEISVNYQDITLYAVYDNSVKISLSTDINLLDEADAVATITSDVFRRNGTDGITFSYSVAEGEDCVTLTDNGDGTASVVSKAEGLSKIVYTASTGESAELYILSDYSGTAKTVRILKEASDITVDAGTSEMKAELFSNVSGERTLSWNVSDISIAAVKPTGKTTALISAIGNGTVTVTAYDASDEDIRASFDVTISNQRQKYAVYDLRIQFWGASTTQHGASASLGWTGNWGMAATSEDKDYVHRLVSRLEEAFYPSNVNFHIVATSAFDAGISTDTDTNKDYSSDTSFIQIKQAVENLKPNIIVTSQTGNLKGTTIEDCVLNAYTQVYDMMYGIVPDAIILSQHCSLSHKDYVERVTAKLAERYAAKNKVFIDDHSQLVGHPEYFASEWLLLDPPQPGVAAHWNDNGMDEISRVMFNYLEPYIRTKIEPAYIYIPESISIFGAKSISTEAGTVKLTAIASPDDASTDVIWSVDNEKLAVINEYGMLTAINNGTVNVTARSKYNDEAVATHKVEITGQPECYTVSYDANTADTVTGMPEADTYARGEYTLSEKRPLRDCYIFAGWGLTPDTTETVTEISVTSDTTVYAVWEKTEGFEFEGTYDENFGYIYGFDITGGFHAEVSGSKISAICTGGEKVRFISPKLDIENKGYISFALESAYTESGATVELTVNTTDGEKTCIYPLTTDKMTTYIADISALYGNVTGFEIYVNAAPADNSMFAIYIDYVRFGVNRTVDASAGEFSVTDGNVTVSSTSHGNSSGIAAGNTDNSIIEVVFNSGAGIEIENAVAESSLYLGTDKTGVSVTVTTLNYNASGKYEPALTKVYSESDGFFTEDSLMSGVMTSYDRGTIRAAAPQGMRVMASVKDGLYQQENVAEYGFIVTKLDTLESGRIRDLVIDEDYISSHAVLQGVAFNKESGTHIVYSIEDANEIFTAALVNIPENKKSLETVLVFRPYIKLSDKSVIYGAKTSRSICNIALSITYDSSADAAAREMAKRIVDICGVTFESDTEIFLPADELFR